MTLSTSTLPEISILITAHNEEGNIPELLARLEEALAKLDETAEVVIVDDGSTDETAAVIQRESSRYPFIRLVCHSQRKGATEAINTGLAHVRGAIIVLMSADLESDPVEDIPLLLGKLAEGYDVVAGRRVGRDDRKQFASWVANTVARIVFNIPVRDMNWIKAFRRSTIRGLRLRSQWHRYLVPIWAHAGFRIAEVPTHWHRRKFGVSKFGIRRLFISAFDFVTLALMLWLSPGTVIRRDPDGNSQLKVCFITSVFPRHEGDRPGCFLLELGTHLKQAGINLKVFAPSFEGLAHHTVSGIEVHRFRYFPAPWENLTHTTEAAHRRVRNPLYLFITGWYLLFGTLAMARFARRERFHILHVHWPFPHGIFGLAGVLFSGARMVLSFHGAEILLAKKHFWIKPFLRFMISRSHGITCNSSFTAKQLLEIAPTADPAVIPYGASIEAKPSAAVDNKIKKILFAGRLVERKGVPYLIRAMTEVVKAIDAELLIVGEGPERPRLEAEINSLGLKDHVQLCGFVSNERLMELYQSCDVFVLPSIEDRHSDTEGLGVVLVEALCYKKPVIASRVGGIVDVVEDGVTGLLVEQKSEDALATAILRVLKNPDLAQRLAEHGYCYAKEKLDWESITRRMSVVYQAAMNNKASKLENIPSPQGIRTLK